MNARLLGLLKLLLQVVLFLATGRWVRFGDERARGPERGPKRQRAKAKLPSSLQRRRVFDARRHGPPLSKAHRERLASEREQGSVADSAAPWEAPAQPDAYALRQEGQRAHAKRRVHAVLTAPGAEPRPRSLAATLRDPRALRESLAIGEALGPRRPRR